MKIPYDKTNQADMAAKIAEQAAAGRTLMEVQNHEDGDSLVFGTLPVLTIEERLRAVEADIAALKKVK